MVSICGGEFILGFLQHGRNPPVKRFTDMRTGDKSCPQLHFQFCLSLWSRALPLGRVSDPIDASSMWRPACPVTMYFVAAAFRKHRDVSASFRQTHCAADDLCCGVLDWFLLTGEMATFQTGNCLPPTLSHLGGSATLLIGQDRLSIASFTWTMFNHELTDTDYPRGFLPTVCNYSSPSSVGLIPLFLSKHYYVLCQSSTSQNHKTV